MAAACWLGDLAGRHRGGTGAWCRSRSAPVRPSCGPKSMTPDEVTVVLGIPIPSTSPTFLTIVGLHVAVGLVCVVAGAIAMLSPKRSGRHPTFGTIYYWSLVAVFVSATALSVLR